MERPVCELCSCQEQRSSCEMENGRIRVLFERQRANSRCFLEPRFRHMTLKPFLIGEMFRNLMEFIELLRREIEHALAGDEQLRRDQQLLHEQLWEQNRDLREAYMKSQWESTKLKFEEERVQRERSSQSVHFTSVVIAHQNSGTDNMRRQHGIRRKIELQNAEKT